MSDKSESARRISVALIDGLKDGDEIFDPTLRGFGVRRRGGSISYVVMTRVKGRKTRITIGRHGSPWTPETARKRASQLLLEVGSGGDPVRREKEEKVALVTTGDVFDAFKTHYLPKLKRRTQDTYIGLIEGVLRPEFGRKLVAELERKDIAKAHVRWGQEHPVNANNALAVMSKIMTWSEEDGYRPELSNPCRKITRFKTPGRERYLDETELARLGEALRRALANGENPFMVAAIGVLLLTGARRMEILRLKWTEVDLVRGQGRLGDSKTGPKVVPLNVAAVAIIEALPRLAGHPYVFPGDKENRPISTVQHVWDEVRRAAKLEDVRLHDLRHSFASFAGDAGGSLPMVGRILGHKDSRTTQRYVHFFDRTPQGLSRDVGGRISAALGGLGFGATLVEHGDDASAGVKSKPRESETTE